jgi:SpoVK/Ycf46/Vps4 family AAA+-type ATPase
VLRLCQVVAKTEGYSGSDMRNLIQEACQGPVRDAVARVGEAVATLSDADLRPVSGAGRAMQTL